MPRELAPRFGIGEWYGHSFIRIPPERRREFAEIAPIQKKHNAPPCPFLSGARIVPCPKKGGICSLRLYRDVGHGSAVPVEGEDGNLRVVCPHRFKQNGTIYSKIGEVMLDTPDPRIVPEVRFLRRNKELSIEIPEGDPDAEAEPESEDVGNIDNVARSP